MRSITGRGVQIDAFAPGKTEFLPRRKVIKDMALAENQLLPGPQT